MDVVLDMSSHASAFARASSRAPTTTVAPVLQNALSVSKPMPAVAAVMRTQFRLADPGSRSAMTSRQDDLEPKPEGPSHPRKWPIGHQHRGIFDFMTRRA